MLMLPAHLILLSVAVAPGAVGDCCCHHAQKEQSMW